MLFACDLEQASTIYTIPLWPLKLTLIIKICTGRELPKTQAIEKQKLLFEDKDIGN